MAANINTKIPQNRKKFKYFPSDWNMEGDVPVRSVRKGRKGKIAVFIVFALIFLFVIMTSAVVVID